ARGLTRRGVPAGPGNHGGARPFSGGMLRTPAYAGRAVFGKTKILHEQPGLNRVARLQGRSVPRAAKTVDSPREDWTEIPVPALVDAQTFERVQDRLADNKRWAGPLAHMATCRSVRCPAG